MNDVAQVSDFFTIAQDSAPQITRDLDPETEKKLHMDVILEVRATGSPRPDARWWVQRAWEGRMYGKGREGKKKGGKERKGGKRDVPVYLTPLA